MEINSVDCPQCGGSIPEQVRLGELFKCSHCGSILVWSDSRSKTAKIRVRIKKQEESKSANVESYLHECEVLAEKGDLERAAIILEDALSTNPEWSFKLVGHPLSPGSNVSASGYALLVHLAGKAKRKELALRFFTRMLELNPDKPQGALRAASEAGIERESQKIARQKGLQWQWWL